MTSRHRRPAWLGRSRRTIHLATGALIALPFLFLTKTSKAEPARPKAQPSRRDAKPGAPTPDVPPRPASPLPRPKSALGRIADDLVASLGDVPAGATIVASPLTTDIPALRPDDLSTRLASLVAGRLIASHAHTEPASLAVARSISGRGSALVYVEVQIAKGTLRATADHFPLIANRWDRLRNPAPAPRAHAFAEARIDAEVRSFLAPVLLERAQVHKAKLGGDDHLAVACGDVDGDGGVELVLASRSSVVLGRIRDGAFVVEKSTPWSKLASKVPVPMRDPIASAVVGEPGDKGNVFVGITYRGGVVVDESLVAREALSGLPIPGLFGEGCANVRPESGGFEGPIVACRASAEGQELALEAPLPKYDAVATLSLVDGAGAFTRVTCQRERTGKLHVHRQRTDRTTDAIPELTMDDVGAEVLLADLDLDGRAEVVSTTNSAGPEDALVVSSLTQDGFTPRLRWPTTAPVRGLAVCPPEEGGAPALVALVGKEVWIVR